MSDMWGRSTVLAASLAAALAIPAIVRAAEVTRVATSFEVDNPFDLDLSVGFARTQRRGKITRERHQNARIADVIELRYYEVTQEMPLRMAIGIFQDLEISVGASLVFGSDRQWRYPALLDEDGNYAITDANSTIRNNCIDARGGLVDPACQGESFTNAQPIFAIPGESHRAGLGNINVGMAWAPLSDRKDDSKPKWVVSFDYSIPSATLNKPYEPTSSSKPGEIGDRVHRFTVATALSKRIGAIDPYVKLHYTLPTAAPGFYSNCDHTSTLGYSENCFKGPWTRDETGIKPQHVGGLLFGAEFLPYDNPGKQQQVGIDIQLGGRYFSEGRTYNELSDPLGKLLYTEDYLSVGGTLGVYARVAEFGQLRLNASLYHDTEHFLTNEAVGKDLDGACRGSTASRCVDLDNKAGEINPNFDFRYDMPGRRFRISEVNVFTVMATGQVNF